VVRASFASALASLERADLPEVLMIDCSHGNSEKDPRHQVDVVEAVVAPRSRQPPNEFGLSPITGERRASLTAPEPEGGE
jgi:phospho-2-dehydro-3-deoxyheptonate aldolase